MLVDGEWVDDGEPLDEHAAERMQRPGPAWHSNDADNGATHSGSFLTDPENALPELPGFKAELKFGAGPPRVAVGQVWRMYEDAEDTWRVKSVDPDKQRQALWRSTRAPDKAAFRRDINRSTVESALKQPPRAVLDGFGRRRGPVYERWQRALAGLLEQCNCKPTPTRITETMVAAATQECVDGG